MYPRSILMPFVWFIVGLSVAAANELARGWGDDIEWLTLEDALVKAKDDNKPIMVLIHKTWCGACKALKPKFAENNEIQRLSESLIMVNLQDDEEPADSKFKPDGGYIPRVIFIDSEGTGRPEFYNVDGNEQYKYYYPMPASIVKSMKRVIQDVPTIVKDDVEDRDL